MAFFAWSCRPEEWALEPPLSRRRQFVFLDDPGVGFGRALDMIGGFAVIPWGQDFQDSKGRRQARTGAELQSDEVWTTEMEQYVVAWPESRH
jgi:hypothetical protein